MGRLRLYALYAEKQLLIKGTKRGMLYLAILKAKLIDVYTGIMGIILNYTGRKHHKIY